ncbi:MAG: hypothetical protein ACRDVZ_11420 [Jiangellaceae bacterium]
MSKHAIAPGGACLGQHGSRRQGIALIDAATTNHNNTPGAQAL